MAENTIIIDFFKGKKLNIRNQTFRTARICFNLKAAKNVCMLNVTKLKEKFFKLVCVCVCYHELGSNNYSNKQCKQIVTFLMANFLCPPKINLSCVPTSTLKYI